jgi:threonine dehydrogenase-like Zn-dependent dehydrogenase
MADNQNRKMKAVRWEGKPFSVSVEEVDVPKIKDPLDAIVRVTSTTLCGCDLHVYRGRAKTSPPLTLGHESLGIVEEIGSDITTLKKGDRVLVTPSIEKSVSDVELALSGPIGSEIPGFTEIGGGQAEYMRVPFADANLLVLPSGYAHELDYLLLCDVLPTANWGLDCAGQVIGDTVVIFGAGNILGTHIPIDNSFIDILIGPVGLTCAHLAFTRGAARVYSVDQVPARLAQAERMGAIPINFAELDPVAEILKREPNGVDRSCDTVGYEAVNAKEKNIPNIVINWAIQVTRKYGGIGLIGAYVSRGLDPSK